MELFSQLFIEATASLLSLGDIRVLCTIPATSSHPFVRTLREEKDKELVEVTRENRDKIPEIVIDLLYQDFK